MFKTTNALILREVRYKEADRILTLFTSTDGKITAKARGALRKNSKNAAATQQLTYSEMTLFGNKGRWTVNEASIKEAFPGLRVDIADFALGSYFAECLDAFSVEDQPDEPMLRLGLNSLYALSNRLHDTSKIKAVFEMRLMCLAGYEPDLHACAVCGAGEPEEPLLGLENGCICCRRCRNASVGNTEYLDSQSLAALRYTVSAHPKRIFSFELGGESLDRLSRAAEKYLLAHADRSFGTLDYWKKIKQSAIRFAAAEKQNELF